MCDYRLLEVIQQFGREKLEAKGEEIILSRRHRDWYLGLAEQAEQELMGKHQGEWLDRLEAEHENLRCALRWSLEQKRERRLPGWVYLSGLSGFYAAI